MLNFYSRQMPSKRMRHPRYLKLEIISRENMFMKFLFIHSHIIKIRFPVKMRERIVAVLLSPSPLSILDGLRTIGLQICELNPFNLHSLYPLEEGGDWRCDRREQTRIGTGCSGPEKELSEFIPIQTLKEETFLIVSHGG